MSRCIARRSRPLRGRTYSGERRSVLTTFFTESAVSTSQPLLHKSTRAAHPNRHCSALPRAHRRVDFTQSPDGKYRNSGYLSMDGAEITAIGGGPLPPPVTLLAGSNSGAGSALVAPESANQCFFSANGITAFVLRHKDGEEHTFTAFPGATPVRILGGCLFLLTQIKDVRGRTLSYARGGNGAIGRIDSSSGRWVTFAYGNGVVQSVTDSLGRSVSYAHEELPVKGTANGFGAFGGLLSSGSTASSGNAALARIELPASQRLRLYRMTGATTPEGTYSYSYDDDAPELRLGGLKFTSDVLAPVAGPAPRATELVGGVVGNTTACDPQLGGAVITSVTLPGMTGAVTNTYGPSKRVHKQLWPDGREYRFAYTLSGACTYNISAPLTRLFGPDTPKVDSAESAAAGWRFSGGIVVGTKVFDNQDQLLQAQKFNGDRLATQATDAQGQGIQYGRDAANRITSITDPLGRVTRKFYDSLGNLTKVIDPAGRVSETAYATFNGIVKPVSMTRSKDVGVQSSSMTYENVRANLLSATNPIGQTTSFAYDASNTFMTSVTSPLGHITRFQHNSAGDVTKITDPLNNETNFTRDAVGRLTSVTDPQGHSSQYQYNALNQLTQGTDAIGGATKLAYDSGNRLASVTDPNNNPVERYAYDSTGKLTTRTDAVNQASTYSYDGRGRITGMLDRKGQTGTIEYDIAGRVARTVLADATMDYTYDAAGRMTQLTETPTGANSGTSGGVKRVTLTYDILDRVTQERHEAGGITTVTDHQYVSGH